MAGSREDQFSVGLVVDDDDLGTWDKQSGGMTDSEETKFKRGGMGGTVSLGGTVSEENITLNRLYDLDEVHPLVRNLRARVGKARCVCTKQPLDIEGDAKGDPTTFAGTLKSVADPDHDSESNDAALLEVEISIDEIN